MSLIPQEPYSTLILYNTFRASVEVNSALHYPVLIQGVALSIFVGIVEYSYEKIVERLQHKGSFNLTLWKTECRIWQMEMALKTVAAFILGEIDPAQHIELRKKHYLQSIRSSKQWLLMDERDPLIIEAGQQVRRKAITSLIGQS